MLSRCGAVSGSTTFPGQCVIELLDTSSVYTETHLILTTYDVNGKRRNSGGDPVKVDIVGAKLKRQSSDESSNNDEVGKIEATIKDGENGTYSICFMYFFLFIILLYFIGFYDRNLTRNFLLQFLPLISY